MWENSRDKLHIDAEELWFPGVYGQPVPKPVDIKRWEDGKCYLLLDKSVPRLKADRMLQDLSCIALKHAQSSVQQRITLNGYPGRVLCMQYHSTLQYPFFFFAPSEPMNVIG